MRERHTKGNNGTSQCVPLVRVAVMGNRYTTLVHTWRRGRADGGRCRRSSRGDVTAGDLVAHDALHLWAEAKRTFLVTSNDVI